MENNRTSTSANRQSFRQIISCISETILPSEESTIDDSVITSIVLVLSLTVVTPILVLNTNIPLIALIPIVGLSYGIYLYYTDRIFSGITSAFFILIIFKANIPIIDAPAHAGLSLYLVDPLAIVLFGILVYDLDFQRSTNTRLGILAILGLVVFVLWSYLAAAVGNGPSQIAATIFAIEQTRYLFFFIVSLLTAVRMGPKFGIYPLLVSIAGNLLYAIVEAFSGNTLGLTYLGDDNGRVLSELVLGPWTFSTGLYAGGFAGNTRHLIGLLLLFLPFLIFLTVYGSRLVTIASSFGILGVGFIIKFGETDAGLMASILVLVIAVGFFLLSPLSFDENHNFRRHILVVCGIGGIVLLYLIQVIQSSIGDSNWQDQVVDLLSHIPFIDVSTLGVRLTQYAAAIDLSFLYPFFGIGGYNFILKSESYIGSEMGVHNTFFSHLAAVGYPGMIAYSISVFAVLILTGHRALTSSGKERLFWGSALSGLLGFHAYSFWVVIYQWHAPNAGFWAFSGIIVGAIAFDHSSSVER